MRCGEFMEFGAQADLWPGLMSEQQVLEAVHETIEGDTISFEGFVHLIGHCAQKALGKFPYSSKYVTEPLRLEALVSRIAFSDATAVAEVSLVFEP